MAATSATLTLDNQKNGWKGVCVHHDANSVSFLFPIRALRCCYCHIQSHRQDRKTPLLAYWVNGKTHDLTDNNLRTALKKAVGELTYPQERGIPLKRINTHSLRAGGVNPMSVNDYTDRQIQKMGQ